MGNSRKIGKKRNLSRTLTRKMRGTLRRKIKGGGAGDNLGHMVRNTAGISMHYYYDTTVGAYADPNNPTKISQVITIERKEPKSMNYDKYYFDLLNADETVTNEEKGAVWAKATMDEETDTEAAKATMNEETDTEAAKAAKKEEKEERAKKNIGGEIKKRIILNKEIIKIDKLDQLYPIPTTGTIKPIWLYDYKDEFEPNSHLDHVEFVQETDGTLTKINYYCYRPNDFLKSWAPCTLEIQNTSPGDDIITINGNNIIFNVGSSKFTVDNVNLEEMTTAPSKDNIDGQIFNKGKLGLELLSHILKEAPQKKTPCSSSVHAILKVIIKGTPHLVILVTDHFISGMGLKLGPGGSVDYPGKIVDTLDKEMYEEMGLKKGDHYTIIENDKIVNSVINIKPDKQDITAEHPVNVTMQSLRHIKINDDIVDDDITKILEDLFRKCKGVPKLNGDQRESWAYFLVPFDEGLNSTISKLNDNYNEDGTFKGGTFDIKDSILISDNYGLFLELAKCRGLITEYSKNKNKGRYDIKFKLLATGIEGKKYTTDTLTNNIEFYNSNSKQKWAIKSKASNTNLRWHSELALALHEEFATVFRQYKSVYTNWTQRVMPGGGKKKRKHTKKRRPTKKRKSLKKRKHTKKRR